MRPKYNSESQNFALWLYATKNNLTIKKAVTVFRNTKISACVKTIFEGTRMTVCSVGCFRLLIFYKITKMRINYDGHPH